LKSLLLTLLLWMTFDPVIAHDIGVSQASLVEQDNNIYQLTVQAGRSMNALFSSPVLPKQCQPVGIPRGIRHPGQLKFEFSCEQKLTAKDIIDLPWRRDGVMLSVTWSDGTAVKRLFSYESGNIRIPLAELQASSGSWLDVAKRYTKLGIEHILLGIDHLLFVLALLLIVRGRWMLVKTITAFTIAHSITLSLATLGFVYVPSRPVEAVIALSIVFLCIEIIHAQRGKIGITFHYPWIVAFTFGLLHGLGFASALSEIGLAHAEIPLALLFFNVGVEIGQLLFVGAVLTIVWVVGRLWVKPIRYVHLTSAYIIGTIATYWLIQRVAIIFT